MNTIKYYLATCIVGCYSYLGLAQCPTAIGDYTNGFEEISAASFSFLEEELDEVKIVGYGEDTHGTAEFTTLAQELMKYLVEEQEFKVFIIEAGFGEGQYFNDYIQGKEVDLKTILEKHNSTWRYMTKEFADLMNWLKSYNETHTEKIHIYGCEMQYVISDVNRIKDYLTVVKSDYVIEGFEKHLWQQITAQEKIDYYMTYVKLKQYFIDHYEEFVKKTSEDEFSMAYQHVLILGQFVTAIHQNWEQRKHDFRDIYMAENIQWIMNFHGDESKALYWAHNAHIGDWINNGIVDVAGHQLRKIYGEAYYNIATDFGTGEFVAFSQEGSMGNFKHHEVLDGTLTKCLQALGKPNVFLSIRKARSNESLNAYFDEYLTTMSGAGAQVRSTKTETNDIGKAFDAIIYLDKTHPINWY